MVAAGLDELRKETQERARHLVSSRKDHPWKPPELGDFDSDRPVLAFDQSLANTGLVRVIAGPQGIVPVYQVTLHPLAGELTGFMGTWAKASSLNDLLHLRFPGGFPPEAQVVVEQPLIGRGKRPESALVAGSVIYEYANGRVISVSARHASSVLCGNPDHDKKQIAAAVARYIPQSAGRPWSEHSRDAAALALTYLWDCRHNPLAPPSAPR